MDHVPLNLRKMFNSEIFCLFFEKAQELEGLMPLKFSNVQQHNGFHMVLQHKELSCGFVHRLILSTIYFQKQNAEVKGVQYLLLRPNVILIMLLLANFLVYMNRFSCFPQICSFIYSTISGKLA